MEQKCIMKTLSKILFYKPSENKWMVSQRVKYLKFWKEGES